MMPSCIIWNFFHHCYFSSTYQNC